MPRSVDRKEAETPQHFPVSTQAVRHALRELTGEYTVTDPEIYTRYQDKVHSTFSGFAKGVGLLSRLRAMDYPQPALSAHALGMYLFFASAQEHERANMLAMPEVTMADYHTMLLHDVAATGVSTESMEPVVHKMFSLDDRDNAATIEATARFDRECDKYLAVPNLEAEVDNRLLAFLDEEPNFYPELLNRWQAPELLMPMLAPLIWGAADCKAVLQNALTRSSAAEQN